MIKNFILGLIVGTVLLIFGAFVYSAMQPKPYNWNPNIYFSSKQPYGASILKSQLPYFFPGKRVRRLQLPDLEHYYPFVTDYYDSYTKSYQFDEYDSTMVTERLDEVDILDFNFVGLGSDFEMSVLNIRALWLHLYQGNEALIVASDLPPTIEQNLGISIVEEMVLSDAKIQDDRFAIQINNGPFIKHKSFNSHSYIADYPDNAHVIAKNKAGQVLGISLRVGKGKVTYFSNPMIFTNYYLLNSDLETTASLLKTLPLEDTYFANHALSEVTRPRPKSDQKGIMSFIHSNKALTWAFYTLLFSILLFMLFRLKRMQRIIPVIEAPENASLKYTNTLSNLYLMHNNHKEMALKKMNYFLSRIRFEYNLDSSEVNEDFYKRLSIKTGVDLEIIKKLFVKYHYISAKTTVSSEDFLEFCKLLQYFKN